MKSIVFAFVGFSIAASAISSVSTGPQPSGKCVLWEHRNMEGAHLRLPSGDFVTFAQNSVGNSTWREFPRWNDRMTSATVSPKCRLRVWEHIMATGASKEWYGGKEGLLVNYVGDNWNDRVSSATCTCD